MNLSLLLICFLFLAPGVQSDEVLTQTDSQIYKKPNESFKLTCRGSGFDFSQYGMHWIRQESGKGLEWLGVIWYDASKTVYGSSVEGRVTITRDNKDSVTFLELKSLVIADSATYFCASTITTNYAMDIWGQGTMVTVTSAKTSAPSVFPLVPCCSSVPTDKVSIGCLSTGYLPTPVEVQWNSGSITSGIRNFPAVLGTQGTYVSTSLLTIPTSEWTNKKYVCNVNHKPSNTKINKEIEACSVKTSAPEVKVMQASCGGKGSVDLVCLISGYSPKDINVQWLLNRETTSIIPSNSTPYKEDDGTFGSSSKVSVPKDDWNAGDTYTCKVTHAASDTKNEDTIKKCQDTGNIVPKVVVLPPSPKDILITKQPKVTCQVSQVESPDSLTIKWNREDGKKALAFSSDPEIDNSGRYIAKSTLKLSLSDWQSGKTFTCIVQNNDLPSPIEKSIKITQGQTTEPSIYVFPPHADELATQDFVSVTCLLKGFKPKDIYVQWLKNKIPLDEEYYSNTEPVQQDDEETFFMYSTLLIDKSDWNRGATMTCRGVNSDITSRDIKKSSGK